MDTLEEDSRDCFSGLCHSGGVGSLGTANHLLCSSTSTGKLYEIRHHATLHQVYITVTACASCIANPAMAEYYVLQCIE